MNARIVNLNKQLDTFIEAKMLVIMVPVIRVLLRLKFSWVMKDIPGTFIKMFLNERIKDLIFPSLLQF